MKNQVLGILLACVLTTGSNAQEKFRENVVGETHVLFSKALGTERTVDIYVPPGYETSNDRYPVLYLLDGQRFFTYAVSLQSTFQQFQFTPDFVIVGIQNTYPDRFNHFSDGREMFERFIVNELKSYVDDHFRSSGENLLFGWEYGGGLAFDMLLSYPHAFDGYLLASPFPIAESVNRLDSLSDPEKTLFFGVSPDEHTVTIGVKKLDSLLLKDPPHGLKWTYLPLPQEEHRSTGYPVLYHGLLNYFQYYRELEVNNLLKFLEAGGLDFAQAYAKERSRKFGFPEELSLWSSFTIIRSAMRANDFARFQQFLEGVGGQDFIRELVDNRSYAASDVANFYERHNAHEMAVEVYQLLLEKYPNSESLLLRMGKALQQLGREEADEYLERAVHLQDNQN